MEDMLNFEYWNSIDCGREETERDKELKTARPVPKNSKHIAWFCPLLLPPEVSKKGGKKLHVEVDVIPHTVKIRGMDKTLERQVLNRNGI